MTARGVAGNRTKASIVSSRTIIRMSASPSSNLIRIGTNIANPGGTSSWRTRRRTAGLPVLSVSAFQENV